MKTTMSTTALLVAGALGVTAMISHTVCQVLGTPAQRDGTGEWTTTAPLSAAKTLRPIPLRPDGQFPLQPGCRMETDGHGRLYEEGMFLNRSGADVYRAEFHVPLLNSAGVQIKTMLAQTDHPWKEGTAWNFRTTPVSVEGVETLGADDLEMWR